MSEPKIYELARAKHRDLVAGFEMHFAYVISTVENGQHVSPVKIGVTKDIKNRLSGIQTSCPNDVAVTFAFPLPGRDFADNVEKTAHVVAEKHWRRGEWFNLHPCDALCLIGSVISALSKLYGRDDMGHTIDLGITGVYDAFLVAERMWPDRMPPRSGAPQ